MLYEKLHTFLATTEIPVVTPKIGFLEIIGKQHHENINSALYAHFINTDEDGIRDVFLQTLLELIKKKAKKNLEFIDASARTEVTTKEGRIDILIRDRRQDSAIIIENKIYHWLNNPLLEYWEYVKVDDTKKVGVLLTLESHTIPGDVKDKYINITHLEWVRLIKDRLDGNELPTNYRVYMNDFVQTIENLSTTYEMNEAAKFYFQHAKQVKKANQTMNEAHDFLQNQLQAIADKIGWQTYGNSLEWRNFWDEANQLDTYLTILTHDLLEGKMRYTLILELFRDDRNHEKDLREFLKDHPQTKDKQKGTSDGQFLHFLCKDYIVTEDELANLSKHVVDNIHNDFADMTLKVIQKLYPKVNTAIWEETFTGKQIKKEP